MLGICPAKTEGTIFAIKRYAIHDGPDLRTTVFFKGCPLSCWWCHNPEGLRHDIGMVTVAEKCVGCGECIDVCPQKALKISSSGPRRKLDLCKACGLCAETCPALAHEATGYTVQADAVLQTIEKDSAFYNGSQGGVTFSGGEPLSQPGFLLEMLRLCGKRGLHRVVDTSGFAENSLLLHVAKETDLFLFDLKHMDSALHEQYTGVPNERILENLRSLARQGHAVQVRMPLIPGINDDEKNLRATGEFVSGLPGIRHIDVLPYHGIAKAKYTKLGMEYKGADIPKSAPEDVQRAVRTLEGYGLKVRIGG
ncbi:glycyl-radical enzyme activating protein [Desulfovibrio mangrovi]|uniref:glycyl-radical enzyme activating protein n=1 Tax=Desulfovibrio mangrovi TaxID=2976983 RepID=UPI0022475129|nr:glycyl-radical enzyme activating protein [Desulfovibrio mangrovi]UZP66793.1 glycyl-radical enzyme activating protein [Desulfovibrio mangrovi]